MTHRIKGKRILITGGTGMIGEGLARRFVTEGAKVATLSRSGAKHPIEGVEALCGDITDPGTLDFKGFHYVVHGAAFVGFGMTAEKNRIMWDTNVEGTRHVLDAAKRDGAKRVLHISSVAAIGRTGTTARGEEWVWQRPETFHSEYERSKYHAHKLALTYDGLDVVAIMPSIVLGVGDTTSGLLFKRFLQGRIKASIKHPGDLSFVHVDDVADAAVRALRKGKGGYVVSERGMTLPELFDLFAEVSGRKAPGIRLPLGAVTAGVAVLEPMAHLFGKKARINKDFLAALREGSAYDAAATREGLDWAPNMERHLKADAKAFLATPAEDAATA